MDSSRFIELIDNLSINLPSDSKPWYSKLFGWHPLFSAVDADSLVSPEAIEGISDGDKAQEIDVLTCLRVESVDFRCSCSLRMLAEACNEACECKVHQCAIHQRFRPLHSRKWANATPASLHTGVLCTQSG